AALAPACAGVAEAARGADRGGPRPPGVPWRLGAGPEEAPARPAGLPAANQRPERGDAAGADLAGQRGLAEPPGTLRRGSEQEQDPLLHTPAQGPDQSATGPGGGLSAAQSGL